MAAARRADHALITLMIAGTYTPLVTLVGSGPVAYGLLAVIWVVALIGIAGSCSCPAGSTGSPSPSI